MTASGPNAWPSLICARKTLNKPIPTPADQSEAAGPTARRVVVADARHEDHRDDRQRDPDQDQRRRHALEDDPGGDRDERRDDARDRRHDPHPSDGEAAGTAR